MFMVTKLKTAVKKAVKSVMPKKKVGTTKAVSKKAVPKQESYSKQKASCCYQRCYS
jgi:hypothetical protein